MPDPVFLENYQEETKKVRLELEKQFKKFDSQEHKLKNERRDILNQYAIGKIDHDIFAEKSLWYDNEINKLVLKRSELIKQTPMLYKSDIAMTSIRSFCDSAKIEFSKCHDTPSKRTFLFKYITEVVYDHRRVEICGAVPLVHPIEASDEKQKISFKIVVAEAHAYEHK